MMTYDTKPFRVAPICVVCATLLAGCGDKLPDETQAAVAPGAEQQTAAAPSLPRTPAPEGARVFFVTPADGASVTSPVSVTFGSENVEIVPAGDNTAASGHHHLVINAALPPEGLPIPKNDQYVHFGGGQKQTFLPLPPGKHTLTMVLGDHLHIPHDPMVYSQSITIVVTE